MSSWQRGLIQIGGRNAISKWSWILTIPLALLVGSVYAGRPTLADVVIWTSILLVVHCLLGLAMWLAHATVLRPHDRAPRPVMALVVFALLGAGRGLLLQFAQDATGIGGSVFVERMAVNIVGTMIVLSAIAIIVDDFRVDAAIVERLETAKARLSALREQEVAALRAADVDVLSRVQESVERELRQAGTDASRVRAVVDSIVRPISHELAREAAEDDVLVVDPPPVTTRFTFREAFGRMVPPSPLALAVIVEVTVFGSVLGRHGVPLAVANALLGGLLLFVSAVLVRRLVPMPIGAGARIVVVAVVFALIGWLAGELNSRLLSAIIAPFPSYGMGVVAGTAAAALAVSLWTAVISGRRARQEAMTRAVADEAAAVEQLRGMIEQRRLQAARFLHGPIQGELIAAALKGERPEDVRQVIARRFAEYGAAPPTGTVEQQVRDVIDAWSAVLDITFSADDACWTILDADREGAELLTDALSEGLANVVRHAESPEVQVSARILGDRIRLEITSQGAPSASDSAGIGLDQIRARGGDATLAGSGGVTTLSVVIDST